MWYLNSKYKDSKSRQLRSEKFEDEFIHHMNVEEAWNMGYSGKGVVVSIIDDGIEYTHEGTGSFLSIRKDLLWSPTLPFDLKEELLYDLMLP